MSFANSQVTMCMGELHKNKEDTGDFSLTCQGEVIKAHSFILSTGSEFFKAGLSTTIEDNSKTMEVKGFSFEVLSTAVDFMYGIEIPDTFNNGDDLKSLLHLADQYLMENLKNAVSFLIGKGLNMENIFGASHLAEKFGALSLTEKCAEFIFDNAAEIKDEELAEMKEGVVMASLVKKFVKESKKDNWMKYVFDRPDFKKRKDFGSEDDYKTYVMARIKPKMFVRCNTSSTWTSSRYNYDYNINKGHIGLVRRTDSNASVAVNWLTRDGVKECHTDESTGPYEYLDLLTSPVQHLKIVCDRTHCKKDCRTCDS